MTNDMTRGNPVRLILAFMIPTFLGNIFQQFYNLSRFYSFLNIDVFLPFQLSCLIIHPSQRLCFHPNPGLPLLNPDRHFSTEALLFPEKSSLQAQPLGLPEDRR